MRNQSEYTRLAIVALTAKWGDKMQVDAELAFCNMLREDGLWSSKMEQPGMSTTDRITVGLVLRIDADFKDNAKRIAKEERF